MLTYGISRWDNRWPGPGPGPGPRRRLRPGPQGHCGGDLPKLASPFISGFWSCSDPAPGAPLIPLLLMMSRPDPKGFQTSFRGQGQCQA